MTIQNPGKISRKTLEWLGLRTKHSDEGLALIIVIRTKHCLEMVIFHLLLGLSL